MTNDVLLNKAAIIEGCVSRAREEYNKGEQTFSADLTRQDAAILNIQRGCEAALDLAQILVKKRNLGLAQSARDNFKLLEQAGFIDAKLSSRLQSLVGFRNIAVHQYQSLQLPIIVRIIESELDQLLQFSRQAIQDS